MTSALGRAVARHRLGSLLKQLPLLSILMMPLGMAQSPRAQAKIDTLLSYLPTYEAYCHAADARIAAVADQTRPNVATGIVNAQMRCATIRQFRDIIALDPEHLASLTYPQSKFDMWVAGVDYFLSKAEANEDPFAGMTSGLRAFRSKMDGQFLFYTFKLPADYAPTNLYPVDAYLHTSGNLMWYAQWMDGIPSSDPAKSSGTDRTYLRPSGRGNNTYYGIGDTATVDEINHFLSNYAIDQNRVILGGGSMGGTGGVRMTCLHPDLLAAGYNMTGGMAYGAPAGGMYDARQLKENLAAVSFLDFDSPLEGNYAGGGQHALHEWLEAQAALYPGSYDHIEMTDPTGSHVNIKDPYLSDGWAWMRSKTRNLWPDRVIYKTYSLRWDGAYWAHFDTMVDPSVPAKIVAEVKRTEAATVTVTLDNSDRFHLDLTNDLLNGYASANVVINSAEPVVAPVGGTVYFWRTGTSPDRWIISDRRYPDGPIKKRGVSGPANDIFMDGAVMVVYGTLVTRAADTQNKMVDDVLQSMLPKPGTAGDWVMFRTDFERKPDTAVTADDIANKNLVLVGRPYQNSFVAGLTGLPITFGSGDSFSIGGKTFSPPDSYAVIFPNPLNPEKYVLLVPEDYALGRIAAFPDVMVGRMINASNRRTTYQATFPQDWGLTANSASPGAKRSLLVNQKSRSQPR